MGILGMLLGANALFGGGMGPMGSLQGARRMADALGVGDQFGIGSLFGSSESPYMSVGDPSDVTNVNPYTGQVMSSLQDLTGSLRGNLFGGEGLISDISSGEITQDYDPQSAINQFLSLTPQLQGVATETTTGGRAADINDQLAGNISRRVSDQFQGNPQSGAFASSVSSALAEPMFQAQMQREALRNRLLQGLYGDTLSQLGRGDLAQMQMRADLARAALGEQMGLLGQTMGMQTQMGQPEWWEPTYVRDPDYVSSRDILGIGSSILGSILGGGDGGGLGDIVDLFGSTTVGGGGVGGGGSARITR